MKALTWGALTHFYVFTNKNKNVFSSIKVRNANTRLYIKTIMYVFQYAGHPEPWSSHHFYRSRQHCWFERLPHTGSVLPCMAVQYVSFVTYQILTPKWLVDRLGLSGHSFVFTCQSSLCKKYQHHQVWTLISNIQVRRKQSNFLKTFSFVTSISWASNLICGILVSSLSVDS